MILLSQITDNRKTSTHFDSIKQYKNDLVKEPMDILPTIYPFNFKTGVPKSMTNYERYILTNMSGSTIFKENFLL